MIRTVLALISVLIISCSYSSKKAAKKILKNSEDVKNNVVKKGSKRGVKISSKTIDQLDDAGFNYTRKKNNVLDVLSDNDELLGTIRGRQITCIATDKTSKKSANKLLQQVTYLPNFTYKYNNRPFTYKTDNLGRVTEAKIARFEDRLPKQYKTYSNQDVKTYRNGLPDDQAGHLIAARFGGPPEMINFIPQNKALNNGAFKSMENYVYQNRHKIKNYTVRPFYSGNNLRPNSLKVSYEIDGKLVTKIFNNN